nr:toll/interleukin-1 receptor domain-containing protein [Frankia canadensis]
MSYAEGGLDWAKWIAAALEEAGYRVRLDAWDVVPGTYTTSGRGDAAPLPRLPVRSLSGGLMGGVTISNPGSC